MAVNEFTSYDDIGKVGEVAAKVKEINATLAKCKEDTKNFNDRELLFEPSKEPTDYSSLGELMKTFEPYENLWRT